VLSRSWVLVLLLVAAGCSANGGPVAAPGSVASGDPIVVIGGGIAGLAAAVEAAAGGAPVVLIDKWSVFGGHAVVSGGGVAMVGTPVQVAAGVTDSPSVAAEDFLAWGQDADEGWVKRYVGGSRSEVHDWLTTLGVVFTEVVQLPGNRVARYHRTRDGGLGLVTPIFRNAVALGVQFRWNEEVTELVVEEGRVIGVRTRGVRDGRPRERRAAAVVLATGGFQNDLERVRASWPADLPVPDRILAGSGVNSLGDGIDLARQAGAALHRMDHQWNVATGLPDPRDGKRGLSVELPQSIWVNQSGARFVDERAGPRVTLPAVLAQPGGSFWAILDADGARSMAVAGPGWGDRARVEREILADRALVARSNTVAGLAGVAGLPAETLAGVVAGHNVGSAGFDIARPPFYAIRLYPLARKSMGGVAVDADAQVVGEDGEPIAGLYAAGEVTGFAGINGRAALEGTFLGPSVLMGRIAGRSAARAAGARAQTRAVAAVPVAVPPASFSDDVCTTCHPLEALGLERPGWLHLAASHRRVRAENTRCASCHPELYPYRDGAHRTDALVESETCRRCHLAP
jgi:predicted oxidoreductase